MVVLSARNMYQIYLYTAPGHGSLWPKHAAYFVLFAPRNVIQLIFDIFINCNFISIVMMIVCAETCSLLTE